VSGNTATRTRAPTLASFLTLSAIDQTRFHRRAVIKPNPRVLATLFRTLGVPGLQVVEPHSIETWTSDHPCPIYGLDLLFRNRTVSKTRKMTGGAGWFANRLSNDACTSVAIFNVLPNVNEGVQEQGRTISFDTQRSRLLRGFTHPSSELGPSHLLPLSPAPPRRVTCVGRMGHSPLLSEGDVRTVSCSMQGIPRN
jgi:hypothetical protein